MGWTTNFSGWVEQATGVKYRGAFPAVQATAAFAHATAGTAPFFVSFSFIEDGIKENYFNREYRWDYDDPTSGNHTQSGESRNTDSTPVAGHVYETAGTYNPTVTLLDANGSILETQTVQIVIADPDVVYAGTLTICISQAGDFTGAPAGASQITAGSNGLQAEVQPYLASDKRILLRAGETWLDTATTGTVLSTAGFNYLTIGSYGAGNRPILNGVDRGTGTGGPGGTHFIFTLGASYSNALTTDIKLIDLDIQQAYFTPLNGSNDGWRGVNMDNVNNVLLQNVRIYNGYMSVSSNHEVQQSVAPPLSIMPSGWCMHQCDFSNGTVGAGGAEYQMYVFGTDSSILDCIMLHYGSHATRTNTGKRMFYAHNELRADGGTSFRDIFKIQSSTPGLAWFAGDPEYAYTRNIVIASNGIQFGNNQNHPLTAGKTNSDQSSAAQRTLYLLYQGCYARVVGTAIGNGLASLSSYYTVMRNCVVDLTNYDSFGFELVVMSERLERPSQFHAYNNTITEFGVPNNITNGMNLLVTNKDHDELYANHNAWYCSTQSANVVNGGNGLGNSGEILEPTVIVDNNFSYSVDPFVNSVGMSAFGDYLLTDSSTYGADVNSRLGKIRLIDFGV